MSLEMNLSPLHQRFLAVALAALPVLLSLWLATNAIFRWSEHHAEIASLRAERARDQDLIAAMPLWRQQIERLRSANVQERYFFVGDQSSNVASAVKSKALKIITANGGTVQQSAVELKSAGDTDPVLYRTTISFSADIAALTRVLYQLRRSRPFLFVSQLAIHNALSTDAALTAPNRLQVDLVVVGDVASAMIHLDRFPPITLLLALFAGSGIVALLLALLPAVLIDRSGPTTAIARISLPGLSTTVDPFTDYASLAERPLFNPGRQKDPVVPPPDTKPKLPPLSDYRLVGIVIVKDARLALVERKATKQTVSLHPGDSLDGRHVDDIRSQGVYLSGADTPELLSIPRADGTGGSQIRSHSPLSVHDAHACLKHV